MNEWTRSERIALYSLLVAVIGVLVGMLTVPEFRRMFGLHSEPTVKSASLEHGESNSGGITIPAPSGSPHGRMITPVVNTIVVRGRDGWKSAQMGVIKGTRVSVSASGSVVWDPTLPAVGPDGAFNAASVENASDFPMPNARCGALIMRIGDTKYAIGSSANIQSQTKGEIEFMINDRVQSLWDNSGNFTVEVKMW
ncbi:MAG: LecA/PA-IL family lectin [Acidobacteriota bacterium]|nr:LecA/PA-IL family lectin [Acidobacteriota bacterium]